MTTMPQDQQFGIRFLDAIAEWMDENLMPEDVFSEESLAGWARENGYVHENANEESTQSDPWLGMSSVNSGRLHWTRMTVFQEVNK